MLRLYKLGISRVCNPFRLATGTLCCFMAANGRCEEMKRSVKSIKQTGQFVWLSRLPCACVLNGHRLPVIFTQYQRMGFCIFKATSTNIRSFLLNLNSLRKFVFVTNLINFFVFVHTWRSSIILGKMSPTHCALTRNL